MASRVSTRISLTAQLRYHLWFEAITYHGAVVVDVLGVGYELLAPLGAVGRAKVDGDGRAGDAVPDINPRTRKIAPCKSAAWDCQHRRRGR